MSEQLALLGEWRTLQQASQLKGCTYDALRLHVSLHKIPVKRVGRTLVVRMSSLESYRPRAKRHVAV